MKHATAVIDTAVLTRISLRQEELMLFITARFSDRTYAVCGNELDNLLFNAEYVNRFGYHWLADMIVAGTGSSAIILSPQRRDEQDPFSRSGIATLLRFTPHLRRAGRARAARALRAEVECRSLRADVPEIVNCKAM